MLCKHPKLIYNRYLNRNVFVPCGKCMVCRIQKTNSLIPRVINECELHPNSNVFFTLTYDNEHLPLVDLLNPSYVYRCNGEVIDLLDVDNGFLCHDYIDKLWSSPPNITKMYNGKIVVNDDMIQYRAVLCKADVQDFVKRLRIQLYRFIYRAQVLAFYKYLKDEGKYDLENFRSYFSVSYWNLLDEFSVCLATKFDMSFYSNLLDFKTTLFYEFKKRAKALSYCRFFVCGEVGSRFFRPHYHGIFHCQNESVARIVCKLIPTCWSFCDWSKVAKRRGKSGRSGLPSLVGTEASSYVSTYVNSHDYRFPLALHKYFKPFCLYSKRPIYGMSSLDKDIAKKVLLGVNYDLQQTKSIGDGKTIVLECSSLCEKYLFPRLPNSRQYSISDICKIILRPFYDSERGVRNFVDRVRNNIKRFYGYINSSSVFDYVSKVRSFQSRLSSYRLRKQMMEFQPSNVISYVKKQVQTFADVFHYSNQNIDSHSQIDVDISKPLLSISPYCKLVDIVNDLVDKPLDQIFCVFELERKKYINKYNSYLFVKHSHSKNSSYYETI